MSADLLDRAVTLHESVGVPVDVFLTTTMVDLYRSNYPALFNRLLTSPVVALSYHLRPPLPYYENCDWFGLGSLSSNQVFSVVTNYETHGLNLITGQPTTDAGGFVKLRALAGYAPFIVGALTSTQLKGPVHTALNKLGSRLAVVHGRSVNLTNRTVYGMYEKPEHVDLRLFETNYDGVPSALVLSNAFQWARSSNGTAPPYFVGVTMHDNDFFAEDSAWVTVYQNGPHVPPWTNAYTLKSKLLTTTEMTNLWNRYEQMVRYVGGNTANYTALNARGILRRLTRNQQVNTTAILTVGNGDASGTFSGSIRGNNVIDTGAGLKGQGFIVLTKVGTGTLTLSGTNSTFSGATKITAGILSLGNSLALQSSPLDTDNCITGDAANGLKTTVTNLTLGGLNGAKNLADVFTTTTSGYSGVTALTLNPGPGAGISASYSGNIANGAGNMSLIKSGSSKQTLTGANGYTGATIISGGTMALSGSGSLATPSISIASNAVFDVSLQTTPTLAASQNLLGTGSVKGSLTTVATTQIYPATDGTVGTLTFNNDLSSTPAPKFNSI